MRQKEGQPASGPRRRSATWIILAPCLGVVISALLLMGLLVLAGVDRRAPLPTLTAGVSQRTLTVSWAAAESDGSWRLTPTIDLSWDALEPVLKESTWFVRGVRLVERRRGIVYAGIVRREAWLLAERLGERGAAVTAVPAEALPEALREAIAAKLLEDGAIARDDAALLLRRRGSTSFSLAGAGLLALFAGLWASLILHARALPRAWRLARATRRASRGLCPSCGYSMSGTPTQDPKPRCPECGRSTV